MVPLAPSGQARKELPEVWCARCEAEHKCCRCDDGGFIRVTASPKAKLFGRAVPCPSCGEEADAADDNWQERAHIPVRFREYEFATWTPDNGRPRLAAQSYAATWPPERPFFILSGDTGLGKTHLAVAILRRVRENHHKTGQFWVVTRLLDRFRATFGDDATETFTQVQEQLRRTPLLVLDDLGVQKATEWATERLFDLVNERYQDGLPLVVTTNLAVMEFEKRISSRFLDANVSTVVQLQGKDRRMG